MGQTCSLCPDQDDEVTSEKDVFRFFMVGTGGAGKTTVVRQLKCLCKDRPDKYKAFDAGWNEIDREAIFSSHEMDQFQYRIRSNIIAAMDNLIEQSHKWGNDIVAKESAARIGEVKDALDNNAAEGNDLAKPLENIEELKNHIIALLNDEGIKATYSRINEMSPEFRIEDGTIHFLDARNVKRMFDQTTALTSEDIVHSRYPTTGIQDFRFGIGRMKIQIHDMGGQPDEIMNFPAYVNQWIHNANENTTNFILYVTSLSDFNVPHNDTHTKMDLSKRTLQTILEFGTIEACGLMIFFNKQDRFDDICAELLKTDNGQNEIIKYLGSGLTSSVIKKIKKGGSTLEANELVGAVANQFHKDVTQPRMHADAKGIYMKYTQAVDPKTMSIIFNAIQNELINEVIRNGGFIFG